MAQGSGVEWTESTWNPVTGCTTIGPGCEHRYAEKTGRGRGRLAPKRGPCASGQLERPGRDLSRPTPGVSRRKLEGENHGLA
jgi:hypothetical protein